MPNPEATVATVSLTSNQDLDNNLKITKELIIQAVDQGAQWIVLPELFIFLGNYDALGEASKFGLNEGLDTLKTLAARYSVTIFAGSIPVPAPKPETRFFNRLYVIGKDGEPICFYDKTHLFNLFDDGGKPIHCESDGFLAGKRLKKISLDGFEIGLAICYDLRFSNFFTRLTQEAPLDAFIIPSAFTEFTGKSHWEILLRSRAIEHQAYVIASNQYGSHSPGKSSYGHSMIIGPWGDILADTGASQGIAISTISKKRLYEVRSLIPMRNDANPFNEI